MLDFLQQNIDITNLSNFKTSAKAKYYFEINNLEDLTKIWDIFTFIKKEKLNFLFVWWGTNILFAFNIFKWVIIKNNLTWWKYDDKSKILESYTSDSISKISISLIKNYLQDKLKRFVWLPWSIGWAVYWNAWCFWLETSNFFLKAEVINLKNFKKEILLKKDMQFEYRNSIFKKTWDYFLIKVIFDLNIDIEKYFSKTDASYFRKVKQPRGNTCGSFFTNPSNENPAWKLIEEVWLKWYKIWWAYFSDKHANFLMNNENWNYQDLLKLISLAKEKVFNKFWIELKPEVKIVYNY